MTSIDQVRYREVVEVRCETWRAPGVALVGEALHAMNPEVGIGSGLGMGDAQALAVAIGRSPATPTPPAATTSTGAGPRWRRIWRWARRRRKVVTGGEPRPEEGWPPPEA
jgi:2-polyprenyl-6-methoxyphenol hydroxylase-like FAD-dependent oxidoreductase